MNRHLNNRKLHMESLEERTLLAVFAGGIETGAEIVAPTEATIWIVNILEDPTEWDTADDVLSLREAIAGALTGDTIVFDTGLTGGTITLSGMQLVISEGITIDASSIGGITIDAAGTSRVLNIIGGDGTNPVELIGLTVTGGNSGDGGGICNDGTLTITNSTISGNTASYRGGGICNYQGTLTITNSTISGNTASGDGGGIYNTDNGTLTITNSTISGNSASYGGGIENDGTLTITNSTISGNTASRDGGGIYGYGGGTIINSIVSGNTAIKGGGIYNNNGTLTLTNSIVLGNTASYSGGGIYNYYGTLTLTNSIVSGNTASDGGGIRNYYGTLTLTNSTVSGNTAGNNGGGIYNNSGKLTITNSAISGNSARFDGGGIYIEIGTLTLTNSTVSGNSATNGGGIYNWSGRLTLTNTIVSLNYASNFDNDIWNYSDPVTGGSNIVGLDPGFVVAPVFENGKLANFDQLDLSLTAGSYAIDHGTNDAVEAETDLAGNPRIAASWKETATVDIGAYEYQTQVQKGEVETPSTVVTTLLDIVDETDGLISLREAVLYAEAGDTVTFDATLAGRRIVLDGAELAIDKSITIDASAVGGITIDGGGRSSVFRVGWVTAGLTALTVQNGRAYYGGGIYNTDNGTLTITNSTISGNTAINGGGIYNFYSGTLTITNSAISGNSANGGGGIYNHYYSTLTITNSAISGNSAHGSGGIYNGSGTLTITNSAISGNSANGGGGGIYNYNGTLTITNSTVSGNSAFRDGGGIYNYEGTLTITNSTISGNTSGNNGGGGIYNYSGTLNLYNSIIAQNTAVIPRNDICNRASINAYNTLSSFTDWTESENCIVYDPSIPLFTDALHGDFTPAENSQAVNKGNNDYVETETDLAGNPRIYGGIVDIGAYEYQGTPSPVPTDQLAVPTITTGNRGIYASYGANRHQITWTAVENASGYELAYSTDGINWSSAWVGGTSGAVGDLTYGSDVTYRVRALGEGPYIYSDWSETKTFRVCPMDVNNDGDISGTDRALMASAWASAWGSELRDENYRFYADINGDGNISGPDRSFLAANWGCEIDDDLTYPQPLAATDTVFAAYESGDFDFDSDVF